MNLFGYGIGFLELVFGFRIASMVLSMSLCLQSQDDSLHFRRTGNI
jgi:hypothetical protein